MNLIFYGLIMILVFVIFFILSLAAAKKKYEARLLEYEAGAKLLSENSGRLLKLESEVKELVPYRFLAEERRIHLEAAKKDLELLRRNLADSMADNRSLETLLDQQKITMDSSYKKMEAEFQILAKKMLDESSQKLGDKSKESLKTVLEPLLRDIGEFKKRVDYTHEEDTKQRSSLQAQMQMLMELNRKISKEAENLTKALKGDTKAQGSWGEMILEKVLEASGLRKGAEYETQPSFTMDSGKRLQPDIIVHLPEKRDVVIDAKVSLVDYDAFVASDSSEDRKANSANLAQSIRRHMNGLSSKAYHRIDGIDSIDIVVMFVAIEGALSVAAMSDRSLVEDALKQNIMLATPTSLLAVLKGIEYGWRSERQSRNVQNIFRLAGDLYDKFAGFASDMDELGSRLSQASRSYDAARNKLTNGRGNITARVEKIKELGAISSKELPAGWDEADSRLIEEQGS